VINQDWGPRDNAIPTSMDELWVGFGNRRSCAKNSTGDSALKFRSASGRLDGKLNQQARVRLPSAPRKAIARMKATHLPKEQVREPTAMAQNATAVLDS